MEQITSSYNLFVDSSTGHNAQSKGDDYIVNLQDAGVHAGEGEFIRMTLNNFSMAKNFFDINETNNKFAQVFDRKPWQTNYGSVPNKHQRSFVVFSKN